MDEKFVNSALKLITDNIAFITTPSPRETKCRFEDKEISVMLYGDRIDLLIDGTKIESSKVYFRPKPDHPVLKYGLTIGRNIHVIDVFGATGFLKAKIKICVDGKKIAGDDF